MRLLFRWFTIQWIGKTIKDLTRVGQYEKVSSLIEKMMYEMIHLCGVVSNQQTNHIRKLEDRIGELVNEKMKLSTTAKQNATLVKSQAALLKDLRAQVEAKTTDLDGCDGLYNELSDNIVELIKQQTNNLNPSDDQIVALLHSLQEGRGIPDTWYDDNIMMGDITVEVSTEENN